MRSVKHLGLQHFTVSYYGANIYPESMPTGLRWFAKYHPFTPIIETLGTC
ncbi:hypothetical protein AB0M44_36760 [Streptosporangium subroseum]